jgi:hypothetical protein
MDSKCIKLINNLNYNVSNLCKKINSIEKKYDNEHNLFIETATGPTGPTGTFFGSSNILTMWFTVYPDQSTSETEIFLTGVRKELISGLTSNYENILTLQNNHLEILVNSVSNTGNIIITGTSIDENTSIPNESANEIITIDNTSNQSYQTTKKWLHVDSVIMDVNNKPENIKYDLFTLGYTDIGNRNFNIVGYRGEFRSREGGGNKSNMVLKITKVQDDGNGKMSLIDMENIQIDEENNNIKDFVRSGIMDNRGYTGPPGSSLWPNKSVFILKQGDFDNYFTKDENILESSIKDEGIIIKVESSAIGGPGGPDYIRLQVRYYLT